VCEKWLKDRRGRVLGHDELEHYQKVVVALGETGRLMGEVEAVIVGHGGWRLEVEGGSGGMGWEMGDPSGP